MYNAEEISLERYKENYSPILIPGQVSIMSSFINPEKTGRCTIPKDRCFPYYQGKTGYCWIVSMLQCISLYLWDTRGEK